MTTLQLLLLEMATYLAQGFMLYFYAKAFFQRRYGVMLTLVNLFVGYAVLYLLSRSGNTVWNLASALVVNTVLLLLLYRETLGRLLFHAALITALQAISEVLCFTILKLTGVAAVNAELYTAIIGKFAYFFLLLLIRRFFGNSRQPQEKGGGFWVLLLMPLASLAVVSVLLYVQWHYELSAALQVTCGAAAVLMLIANVVVFFIYERALDNAAALAELTAIQRKNEADEQYFALAEQTNQETKMLTHDMKNHLNVLHSMDSMEAVGKYIDKLYPQLEQFAATGGSGNKMLDLIVNQYQKQCEREGIAFQAQIRTANLCYVEDVDLTAMLGNLLDNAVEAARSSGAKTVSLSVFRKNERCDAVVVQNSCDKTPQTKKGRLVSTKDERQLHGYGLKSVTATAQKYNALFDWTYEEADKTFTATLVFPKEENK